MYVYNFFSRSTSGNNSNKQQRKRVLNNVDIDDSCLPSTSKQARLSTEAIHVAVNSPLAGHGVSVVSVVSCLIPSRN